MLVHAFLAVATAAERDTQPTPAGLITLTINEFRRLFDALLLTTCHTISTLLAWSPMAPTTSIPSPDIPRQTTPTPMIPNYGCSTAFKFPPNHRQNPSPTSHAYVNEPPWHVRRFADL